MSFSSKAQLNISAMSVIKVVLVLLSVYVLYLIVDIIAMLFIAFVLFSAINPVVDRLHKYHIPRPLGVVMIYLILFIIITSIFAVLTPHIAEQASGLIRAIPEYIERTVSSFSQFKLYGEQYGMMENIQESISFLQDSVGQGAKGVFSFIASIFGGVASFFIILVMTFYLVAERKTISQFLNENLPSTQRKKVMTIIEDVQHGLGGWARAQLMLSFAVFVLVFILLTFVDLAFSFVNIEYILVLALIAGLTEFIPYLGPIMGAVPAVLITLFDSPLTAVIVVIVYFIVQEIENIILVPQVMRKAVGINPIISITALMSGFRIGGIFGAIMAIPLVVAISVIFNSLYVKK
jgi:predicted PurR-regulated permease PerM